MEQNPSEVKTQRLLVYDSAGHLVPHTWGKKVQLQTPHFGKRLLCSTDGNPLEFLLWLLERKAGPYQLCFIQAHLRQPSRIKPCRYWSPKDLTRVQIKTFSEEFEGFLLNDGGYQLLVNCGDGRPIVFDDHDYFYIYGAVDDLYQTLKEQGWSEDSFSLGDHGHRISDNDGELKRLLAYWPWFKARIEATDVPLEHQPLWSRVKLKARAYWFDHTRGHKD